MKHFLFILFFLPLCLQAQKTIYIPQEWQQAGGLDYSFDRSAESDNFIVFWGPLAGDDPTMAPSEIAFDPASILATAEDLYRFYIDTIQFVNDDSGLLSEYKIILVMLHTWTGIEGWAFGGNYDATVGAMWMHPHAALSGPTLAHEFAHTLQNYTWMMNPGHGFIDSSYVGFFWETHAEFMALQRYPSVALEFDMARWLNTNHFHWSSTRHHYQAFIFLQFLKEKDGISMINRLWNESIIGEHPLETYKRLKGINQDELNQLFTEYAMRNVTWDYEIGDLLRQRIVTLPSVFVSHFTVIPERVDSSRQWYKIQNHLAPQDYGYNIIRLYPQQPDGCDKRIVHINLKSQTIIPDFEEAGLRYGLVAVNQLRQPRYSELYIDNQEVAFEMLPDEDELYLVVTGAPQKHHNYAWEIGFPKIYRYPYEFKIDNAFPEGYQPGFQSAPVGVTGALHINGGGFVAATAQVDASVFVGPHAQVLDFAQVRDQVRIEDYAVIKHSAVLEDFVVVSKMGVVGENAHVHGNAVITDQAHVFGGCEVFDSAYIGGNTLIFNTKVFGGARLTDNTFGWGATLHGDILLGGDAEFFSECDNGTYMQVEFAYDRYCDGLDHHPANDDVTTHFLAPELRNYYTLSCDTLLQNIFSFLTWTMCEGDTFDFYGEPLTEQGEYEKVFEASNGVDSVIIFTLFFLNPPILIGAAKLCHGDTLDFYGHLITMPGSYELVIDSSFCETIVHLNVVEIIIDTSVALLENTLSALAPDVIFQWYDCATELPVPGATLRDFTPSANGSYKVRLKTEEGCIAFSECHDVTTVGIHDPQLATSWHVNPNPASDFIEIKLDQPLDETLHIVIYDLLGIQHVQQKVSAGNSEIKINLKNLPVGLYTITVNTKNGSLPVKRFVKT